MSDHEMEMQFADPDWQPGSSRQGRSPREQVLVVPVQIKKTPEPGKPPDQTDSADTLDDYSQGYRAASSSSSGTGQIQRIQQIQPPAPVRLKRRRRRGPRLFAFCAQVALVVIWFTTPLVDRAFHGGWILPLLGILFLPLTTLTYTVVFALVGGVTGLGWFWVVVVLALLLDLTRYGRQTRKRRSGPQQDAQ